MASGGGNSKKRKTSEGDGDRISNLPDSILLEILCRLPLTEDAAKTSVLSKRWRPLWTQLDRLSFIFSSSNNSGCKAPRPSVRSLKTSLIQHASPRVTHLHIAVDTRFNQAEDDDSVNPHSKVFKHQVQLLLSFAGRKRVEVFSLDCTMNRLFFCKKPVSYIFRRGFHPWSSLREFKTVGCNFEDIQNLSCSGLRVLDIGLSNLSGHNCLEDVLSGCPRLESLRLFCCKFSGVHIVSKSLKTLVIDDNWDDDYEVSKIQVSAPLLEHLQLVSRHTSYGLIDVSSLVVANIDLHPDFCSTDNQIEVRRILEEVSHVKELRLSTWFIKALSTEKMHVNDLPAFSCKCLIVHLS